MKCWCQFLPPPDLVVYLRASVPTLLKRIALRGRTFEQSITPQYLEQLNAFYTTWMHDFALCPVLTVPADDLDFVHNGTHLDLIICQDRREAVAAKKKWYFFETCARQLLDARMAPIFTKLLSSGCSKECSR